VDRPDIAHTCRRAQGGLGLVDDVRVDGVHQAVVDLAAPVLKNQQDRHRDGQADDGIGPPPAERDAAGAEHHGERGEAVSAGVQPVGD
jgi:hypothetical protein